MKSHGKTLYLYVGLVVWSMQAHAPAHSPKYCVKKGKKIQGLLTNESAPTHAVDRLSSSIATSDARSNIDALDSLATRVDTNPTSQTQVLSTMVPQDSPTQQPSSIIPTTAQDTQSGAQKPQQTPPATINTVTAQPAAEPAKPVEVAPQPSDAAPVQQPIAVPSTPTEPTLAPQVTAPSLPTPQPTAPAQNKTKVPTTLGSQQRIKPVKLLSDNAPSVEFYFENTDLQNLVSQVADIFDVTFITDEMILPMPTGAKAIKGNKISFKTQKPLTKKDAWNLFITFLDLAGFAVVPQADPKYYRIMGIENAQRSAIPSYIGIDSADLPNNDQIIRYVYFVENSSMDTIKGIVETLRSSTAPFQILQESKAFILTDKAYNIKSLMQIVKELDKVSMPQSLAVLKLRRADAKQVKELYDSIAKTDDTITARLFPARKQPTSLYFPENTKIFAEPRTNTLILLGPKDAIAKIEDFVTRFIDIDIDKPYSPLKVYDLRYADAQTVADIMNNVTDFGRNTEAGKSGGVRGEDKYLKQMSFIADKETNRIVIRGEYDDYLKAIEIIKKLDEPQPQVAIEVLILTISMADAKRLGTALRSKEPGIDGLVGPNVKYQTSGFAANGVPQGIVENPNGNGVQRLLGNLLNLVGGDPTATPGSTILTLGADIFGVWGIFNVLQTITNTQVVSNPFLVATNKTPAQVVVGETRRITTATVVGGGTNQDSLGDQMANLDVQITPQINSDGMIVLTLEIKIDEFTSTTQSDGTKKTRLIKTDTIIADKEVLAIGGLIVDRAIDNTSKVPVLGDIPILGWLFKNKQKTQQKDNLLILISPKIISAEQTEVGSAYTQAHVNEYRRSIAQMQDPANVHDPVNKVFFEPKKNSSEKIVDNFIFDRQAQNTAFLNVANKEMSRTERRKLARKQKKLEKQKQKLVNA